MRELFATFKREVAHNFARTWGRSFSHGYILADALEEGGQLEAATDVRSLMDGIVSFEIKTLPRLGWRELKRIVQTAIDTIETRYFPLTRKSRRGTYSKSYGDFLIRYSDGKKVRYHEMKDGLEHANRRLEYMGPGAWAEFYRIPPAGSSIDLTGSPWTEPFSALEVTEFGWIRGAQIHKRKVKRKKKT